MSDAYAWIIVKDHLADELWNEKGVVGPREARCSAGGSFSQKSAELAANYAHHTPFKMYDDDGELYYSGELYFDSDPCDMTAEAVFGPLDDFGTPNAGATEIRYSQHPEWN